MSRSYKKNPFVTDHPRKISKLRKRFANKRFRRQIKFEKEKLSKPSLYKRYTDSWDICDYRWRTTKKEAINWYFCCNNPCIYEEFPTIDDWLYYWGKYHKRK